MAEPTTMLRCYTFTHWMLRTIQQGIQPAHAIAEMSTKYQSTDMNNLIYKAWAEQGKTMVCCNGGVSRELDEKWKILQAMEHKFPIAKFHEDEYSLGSLMTSMAIILPPEYYNAVPMFQPNTHGIERPASYDYYNHASNIGVHYPAGTPDFALIEMVQGCKLAT